MRLVAVYNPIAGSGQAQREALAIRTHFEARGDTIDLVDVGPQGQRERVAEIVAGADAMIIVGGDGTVQAHATVASETGVPLYQYPLGTENLFAREWGMRKRLQTLEAALEQMQVVQADLASCNEHPFMLMCSVGPDANVVHRLSAHRNGPISHASYVRHVIAEFLSPSIAPLRVTLDGKQVIDGERGILVVANCKHYAMRINPARDASMTDGELDVAFFPITRRVGLLKWLWLSRLGRRARNAIYLRGREVTIENEGKPVAFQIDGEAGDAEQSHRLHIRIDKAAVPVLTARVA